MLVDAAAGGDAWQALNLKFGDETIGDTEMAFRG